MQNGRIYTLVSDGILENMSRTSKKVDYEQALDLTVRLGDCLPPEHLARLVVDNVAQLDLSALYAKYGVRGGEPYAPEMLLGSSTRVRSSVPRMSQWHSASSQATSIPITIHLQRFAARFCPN